jgi:hypothetical protein
MALLLRKAEELRSLQEALAAPVAAGAGDNADLDLVLDAFKAGDYDRADTELERLASAPAPGSNGITIRANAASCTTGGTPALWRPRSSESPPAHRKRGSAIAGVFRKVFAFELPGMQAQALIDHALLNGVHQALRAPFRLGATGGRAPPDSEQRFSTGFLISSLGVYSERAPAPVAKHTIEVALGLARPLIGSLDPIRHRDVWLPLANCFGAVLNNAAKLSGGEKEELALSREAVDVLTRAAEIALADDHPELNNIETNLATAYRLVSNTSSDPVAQGGGSPRFVPRDEAVCRRIRGNAYDSLGNDYTALVRSGPTRPMHSACHGGVRGRCPIASDGRAN